MRGRIESLAPVSSAEVEEVAISRRRGKAVCAGRRAPAETMPTAIAGEVLGPRLAAGESPARPIATSAVSEGVEATLAACTTASSRGALLVSSISAMGRP